MILAAALLLLQAQPAAPSPTAAEPASGVLWYQQPAQPKKWSSEALPIGNGRLGAMLFGGVQEEIIQFNEQSLWAGGDNWCGKNSKADPELGFGRYQDFGEIRIAWDGLPAAPPAGYRRKLELASGIASSSFRHQEVDYRREAFASRPAQVLAFHYGASKPGSLSGRIRLVDAHQARPLAAGPSLSCSGSLKNGLAYAARLHALPRGGSLRVDGDELVFSGCDELTLLLDARTSYAPVYPKWRGDDPGPRLEATLRAAAAQSYPELRQAHRRDLAALLGSVSLDLGSSAPELAALPTDRRLERQKQDSPADPDLQETLFQYGRYLLASSSRPGGLPANLQGLWNDSNEPRWCSDYHNNINVQMNYWSAEAAGLGECVVPLLDFVSAQAPAMREHSKKEFGPATVGWTARTMQNPFGGCGFEWNMGASAWYMRFFYERWMYGQDRAFLAQAYPQVKEICQFWEKRLKAGPDGKLLVPDGWSPEHGPHEDGVAHDQQLVWDLFQNYLEMARAANLDPEYQKTVASLQARLAPDKIGKWGQLQEWQVDRDRPDDTHRHTSHLFAVFPGRQISPAATPELAAAALLSLRARCNDHETAYGGLPASGKPFDVDTVKGDSRRSWTWPWRANLFARLGDGDKAEICIRGLLRHNMFPNLFAVHPPFQMDGNFGVTGAFTEMLLQSHAGEIHLLPALPKAWPTGSARGLRARGGYRVDLSWKDGQLSSYTITADLALDKSAPVKVRIGSRIESIQPRLP
ncbi:MAG: hypothetical protein RL095_3453 [Verrucomicrobiota bacterium]|jgi:alpha-L-fucosidase 2